MLVSFAPWFVLLICKLATPVDMQWRSQGGAGGAQAPPTALASMEAPPTNFVEEEEGRRKF